MFSTDTILSTYFPELDQKPILKAVIKPVIKKLIHEKEFRDFDQEHPDIKNVELIDEGLEYFNFTYSFKQRERENIPAHGRVILVANHPLGSLEALALLQLISEVRPDVKVVANQILMQIERMRDMFLPVDNMRGNTDSDKINAIEEHLQKEGAVLIFPAGEVSRLTRKGIRDQRWRTGFLRIAQAAQAPIVPIHVKARNTWLFYSAAALSPVLGTAMLVNEMFRQNDNTIAFTVGKKIPFSAYKDINIPFKDKAKLFKRHVYALGKGKKGVFQTERGIALPESRADLKADFKQCEHLGSLSGGKEVYLYKYEENSPIIREIGRLRELSFRAVDEGSGKRRDNDNFDRYYSHVVLWDNNDLEIIGSYRLAFVPDVVNKYGDDALYSSSLFRFKPEFKPYLDHGMELGRSFIQPRYWGKRGLDHLWQGVGMCISRTEGCRYLLGAVSISAAMPDHGKALMIHYYKMYYKKSDGLVKHKLSYDVPPEIQAQAQEIFCGHDREEDFKRLKHVLASMGTSVPTLYRQYVELCEYGGVHFLDFGTDTSFANCIDGMVLVDMAKMLPEKQSRYLKSSLEKEPVLSVVKQ